MKNNQIDRKTTYITLLFTIMFGIILIVYAWLNKTQSNNIDLLTLFIGMGIIFISLKKIDGMLEIPIVYRGK